MKRSSKTEHCNLTRKFAYLWKCKFSSANLYLEHNLKVNFSSPKNFQIKKFLARKSNFEKSVEKVGTFCFTSFTLLFMVPWFVNTMLLTVFEAFADVMIACLCLCFSMWLWRKNWGKNSAIFFSSSHFFRMGISSASR